MAENQNRGRQCEGKAELVKKKASVHLPFPVPSKSIENLDKRKHHTIILCKILSVHVIL